MEEYNLIQIPTSLNVINNFFHGLLGCVISNLKELIDSSIMSELTRYQARLHDYATGSTSDYFIELFRDSWQLSPWRDLKVANLQAMVSVIFHHHLCPLVKDGHEGYVLGFKL
jgi:hypothetical protein